MRFFRRYYADLLFVALSLGVLAWLWHDAFSIRSGTYTPSSDYWEHASAVRALLDDPLHPRNPQVDSPESSPRFNPIYVLVAAVARLFGADMLATMGAVSVLNGVLFLAGIGCFFRAYFRDARAPLFALIVMFGSWYDAPHFSNVYSLPVFFATAP
ncbi:MAG TPA: hypothetical protein VGQ57_19905, partial [Polyangiaceae bacterium]|nr:hypothetical protein [Polyangiaceae bacterium]